MYIDQNNLKWERSEDLLSIKCEDGRIVMGNEQMTDEYLVSVAYLQIEPQKTQEERIAELEAQIKALMEKLSQ